MNGAMSGELAASGVDFQEWLAFAFRWYLALLILGAVSVFLAIVIGLQ